MHCKIQFTLKENSTSSGFSLAMPSRPTENLKWTIAAYKTSINKLIGLAWLSSNRTQTHVFVSPANDVNYNIHNDHVQMSIKHDSFSYPTVTIFYSYKVYCLYAQ